MKRIRCLFCALLLLSLAACGSDRPDASTAPPQSDPPANAVPGIHQPHPTPPP